ncbi:MAG: hypothetical protein MUO72_14425 [Bacteroidales bacterium]|nr:hypothetical protein [Bacteroidales bacterium]
MKKLLIIFAFALFLSPIIYAQTYKFYQTKNIHNQLRLDTKTGEVFQIQSDGQKFLVHAATSPLNLKLGRYILHTTENMWTYILLDTFTGKLWQCQYSVEGPEYILSVEINPDVLSTSENSKFTIKPMASMFQFYLINEETGDMWKFQWSTEGDDYRWIERF